MAFTGLSVTCGYAGGDGLSSGMNPVFGFIQWSEEPASGTPTTAEATAKDKFNPVFRIHSMADAWVSIGKTPVATATPRMRVVAGTTYDLYVQPGDKLAWVAG